MERISLVARALVGGVWVVAGVVKLADPAATVRAVRAYELLPESVVPLVGHGLPVLEILVGLCLLAGIFVRTAAGVSGAVLVAFVVGISSAWARGLQIECGCFGGGGGPTQNAAAAYPWDIARDVGLLALSALLVRWPSSLWRLRVKEPALVATGLVAALVLGFAMQSSRDTSGQESATPSGVVSSYAVPAGAADAPVSVTVYEDPMCPFCGAFEKAARAELADDVAAGRLRMEYHVMSFLDGASTTDYSSRAANALAVVLDSAGPEVASRFHDLLFENQPVEGSAGLTDERLVALAVQAGADEAEVRGPIESGRFAQWVVNVNDAASREGVRSTPTVLVDGKPVSGSTIEDLVDKVQDAVVGKAAAAG